MLVIAVDDVEASVQIAALARRHFPHLRVLARARNRQHAFRLMDLGVEHVFRETLGSSLEMAEEALVTLGATREAAARDVRRCREHDEATLAAQAGKTIREEKTFAIDYEELLRAIGVRHVVVVDPYDLSATESALKTAMALAEPAVVISRRACVLLEEERAKAHTPYEVLADLCEECDLCLKIGCPPIDGSNPVPEISRERCIGCDLCAKLCHFGAIVPVNGGAQ